MSRYIRIRVTAEWGEWQATLGTIHASESHATLRAMPTSLDDLGDLILDTSEELAAALRDGLGRREEVQRDVLQEKNYGPKL